MNTGEVTDPRVKAILLGGGAVAAGLPFGIAALEDRAKRQPKLVKGTAHKYRMPAVPPPKTGIMSTLGRMAGPAGTVAGMLMPTQMGDATLQGNEQMLSAEGTGITSGLAEVAQETQVLEQEIDAADDYAGVMNALRGDNKTIEERRGELATHVGSKDADATPESVLTLVQPTLNVLEVVEQEAPEGGINSGMMQAPDQQQAMARMAMGEQPVNFAGGGFYETDLFDETLSGSPGGLDTSIPEVIIPGEDVKTSGGIRSTSQSDILRGLLENVPEAQTVQQLLPKYQELYGDASKAYELNPYIAGLNLAAAVANAPKGQLLQSILSPETIKSVSDPILEMAKAKGKGDLLAKKAAMEAATASSGQESKAKQAILTAAVPKMLEKGGIKTEKIDGDLVIIDEDAMRAAAEAGIPYKPQVYEGSGTYTTISIGDNLTVTTNDKTGVRTYGGTKAKDYKEVVTEDGTVIAYNKNDPKEYTVVKEGEGKVFGDFTKGFIRIKGGKVEPIRIPDGKGGFIEHTGDMTELQKNGVRFGELTAKEDPTAAETAELRVLTKALIPDNKGEFERILSTYIDGYRDDLEKDAETTGLSPEAINARVAVFEQALLKQYVDSKLTKPGGQYDPQAALKMAFSKALSKSVEGVRESVVNANNLAADAQAISALSGRGVGQYEGGVTGRMRLTLGKFLRETDLAGAVASALGVTEKELFDTTLKGDLASGELQRALGDAMVVKMAGAFPGNLNETEIQILKAAALGIGKSPEANKLMSELFTSIAARKTADAEKLNQYLVDNADLDAVQLRLGYDRLQLQLEAEARVDNNPALKVLKDRAVNLEQRLKFVTAEDIVNNFEDFAEATRTNYGTGDYTIQFRDPNNNNAIVKPSLQQAEILLRQLQDGEL